MALKFGKTANKNSAQDESKKEEKKTASGSDENQPKFLKKGKAAQKVIEQEEAKAEARAAQNGKAFRYRIKYEKNCPEVNVTFLDGELDEEGMLDIPYAREHTVKINGRWENFICTEDDEGYCPICADGDEPSLVGYLSVVDHRPYTLKNGSVIEMARRLFVAKKATIQLLTNQAQKRGGLTGCTFGVTRTGEREPAVGNQFDFVQKDSIEDLIKMSGEEPEMFEPLNYEEELAYHTGDELLELGVGKPQTGPGTEKGVKDYSGSM